MDNGLSNFVVTSLYKDSVGFMWIGTYNSLDRFDGVEFRHYHFTTGDVNKKWVRFITETLSGRLYVANAIGLWKVNKTNGGLEQVLPKTIDCGVTALKWNSQDRNLYIGTEKGLFVLDLAENVRFIPIDNSLLSPSNYITGITFDDNNLIWMTTKQGVCSYDKVTRKINLYPNNLKAEQSFLSSITRIGHTLYMGTSKTGIMCFDTDKKTYSKSVDVGSDIITYISSDGKNTVYVGTDGNGVHFISHSEQRVIRSFRYEPGQKNGIRSNSIYSLLVDRDGIIWVGFYQAGLDYSLYQKPIFDTYSFPPYFDSYGLPVRTFLVRDNEKLIGTREGLYFVNEHSKVVKSFKKDQLRSNLVLSLCYYKGEYYIGTYGGGVSVLNPQTMTIRSFRPDFTLTKGHCFHFEEDKAGNLWIATSGGLYRYRKETNELLAFTNSNSQLYAGNVFYVFFDSSQKGWIATENGLCIYDPQTKSIKSNVFPGGFFNKEIIKVIHEDSNHKLYFCADKGNIFVSDMNMRNFSSLKLTGRFKERVFLSVLEDRNHNYWFGSDNGLISMKEGNDTYHSFGFADGIPDNVFSTDAAFMDKEGKLWFGNAKGLLSIDSKKLKDLKKPSFPVVITDFQVNGGGLNENDALSLVTEKKIKLSYNENNFKFKFVSLQYTNPATVVYEYKLEGYDKEWQVLPGGQNEVQYNDIPAGNYVFIVRTEGNEASTAKLEIKVNSFFSYGFWIILIVILSVIYLFTSKLMILYRKLKEKISTLSSQNKDNEAANKQDEKYKNLKITEAECKAVCDKLYKYIETEKPFTNPDIKIVDLAQALNCSSHTLSFIFNQYLTKNYYDFINEYRVKEFQRLVADVDSSRYTLSALAEQCGFSSRASFFRSFKKLTGITPNEYIKNIGRNILDKGDEIAK
jgi:ligand-binding sensor domain-containing protein/AraC-like DNA-binding protein